MLPSSVHKRLLRGIGLPLLLCSPLYSYACWEQAAQRYGVPAPLLVAIARVESGMNPHAVNRSYVKRTGTYDVGLMQINSSHLPVLAKYGIHEADLFDACTNIHVGAWLLAQDFARHGMTWDGVGAYNASCTTLSPVACKAARLSYAWRVYGQMITQQAASTQSKLTTKALHAKEAAPLIFSAKVSS